MWFYHFHFKKKVKNYVPLFEIMNFLDFRNETLYFLSNVGNEKIYKNLGNFEKITIGYDIGSFFKKNLSTVDPFYLALLINNRLEKKI